MYKIIGIDEAGRGPVIGSLFIGFAIIILEKKEDYEEFVDFLDKIGVKDSKKLSKKKRKEVAEKLKESLDFKYVQLTPEVIDKNIFSGTNLNELQINSIVHILNIEKPDLIFVDALTSNSEKYKQKLLNKLNYVPDNLIAENKADDKYKIVGAASIIAKELREKEISDIKKRIGIDFGSGYPSDPLTKSFIKENYNKEFNFIFRKSWMTYRSIIDSKKKNLKDFF